MFSFGKSCNPIERQKESGSWQTVYSRGEGAAGLGGCPSALSVAWL